MATDPNQQSVTTETVYALMQREQQTADQRHRFVTGGLALVFSAVVPGLGLLFLRWYKWAFLYFVGAVLLLRLGHTPEEKLGLRICLGILWLVCLVHTGAASELTADRLGHARPDAQA